MEALTVIVINGRFLTEHPTGVQRYASELARALSALRPDVTLLTPSTGDRFSLTGVDIRRVGTRTGVAWEQRDLPAWLRRHGRPLLVNLANRAPLLYRNQVSALHDLLPMRVRSNFSLRFRLQFRLVARFGVVHGSHRTVTVSESARREIRAYYGLEDGRLGVVPNGVDREWARPVHGACDDRSVPMPFVLAFGRAGAHRNASRVVDAMMLLPRERRVRLVLVGSPDPELMRAAGVLGDRCSILGRIPDSELAELYRNALCFVAPSRYEGFDLPPLEAQTTGTPVLASDIPVHREILGDGALFFDPDDSAHLADLIRLLATDREARDGLAGRAAENSGRFGWDSSARLLNDLIESVRS